MLYRHIRRKEVEMYDYRIVEQVSRKKKHMSGALRKVMVIFAALFVLMGITISQCAGGHAGSEGEGHGSMLQLRDFPLHDMGCRVGFPPVNEAVLLVIVKVEIRLKIREHMKRVHENRRNHSSEIFLVLVAGVGDSEKIVHVHLCLL